MTPPKLASTRGWVLWLSIAVWAIGGAAFSLTRTTALSHARSDITLHGFCVPTELLTITRKTYAPGVCTIEIVDDGWRPMRVDVRLKAPELTTPGASSIATARISVNDGAPQQVAIEASAGERAYSIDVPPRARTATTVVVRIETSEAAAGRAPPVDVGTIDVVRVLTTSGRVRAVTIGGVVGIIAWWLIVPPLRRRVPATAAAGRDIGGDARWSFQRRSRSRAHAAGDGAFVLVWLALCLYFGVWALVRPPYQTPDEVQHHLRATAVLRHPWFADGDAWSLDPRFTNPLAQWTPGVLDKLFFDPRQRLRLQEITAIQAVEWPAADARPAPETYRRAIASYPTLYYLAVFGLAEPVTRVFGLTPYQSTFAYRLASVALAALLWAAVHRTLRRTESDGGATRDLATPIVLFLVLNPMVAFMSSGINPDGVNVPLATLAILLLWRVLTAGTGLWAAAALVLIATAWTKPSGLQVIVAFALAAGVLWMLRRLSFSRLRLAGAVVSASALVAWCGFYAWSPPRFLGGPPVPDTLFTFLTTRWLALPETWVAYWGRLGWLEYSLPAPWYVALVALIVLSVVCVLVRPFGSRLFAGYAALFLGAFLVVTLAGEFSYLPTAGYFLQGRHLLPASIGLAALMLHRVRGVRVACLALLLAMNVLLLHETVLRYYTRGWSAVPATLPFAAGSTAKPR